ncbi:Crp/Fnr family transcriptional regulator [Trinickia dabaoshanensis]|uniref:Crp/Fnr family transcriptional regulator n=1 Tax=Trinickia dabaoshanensis TaxID=564714 RepID=A0A2N7VCI3_9BURK|nr:Crp/Fnr family transcriptional regulator [Trinickia dabaoshanensis]PMS14883.1 Crp/Fnr family transcriptional regulator [Trinickia dabaoshanensis]
MQKAKIRVQDFLARMPLFNELSAVELDRIAQGTTQQPVARKETVFNCGDPCTGLHAIVYGQIKLSVISPLGEEKVVRLVGPGDSFGEALMFLGKPYFVSAQALADSLLLHVSKAAILDELRGQPDFACKMLAGMSERLHALMRDVEAYSLRSGTHRVISYLLAQPGEAQAQTDAEQPGMRVQLEAGKKMVASRLNLTPEHFSRILHELGTRGLVAINGREIVIPDPSKLRAACAY